MKRLHDLKIVWGILALVLAIGTTDAMAQKRKPVLKRKATAAKRRAPVAPAYTVPAGTIMRVRMNQTITSKRARVGDTFTTTVTEPVYSSNGVVVIPTGSTITGRVDAVVPAGKSGKVGQIDTSFKSVRLPNGRTRAINGSLTSLEADGVNTDNEGTASGKKMGNRKLIFIGGGGVGGAVIGGAIGGGKGALIGGLLGAGGGFLGDKLTKGKEAEVESGTEFSIYLNRAISMPRFAEVTP